MLHIEQLSGGYDGKKYIQDVSFHVEKGEVLGILGPNGSGKSTILKLISGAIPYSEGTVLLDKKPLKAYTPKDLARKLAVLPQLHANTFTHTVREVVSLGRYPHQRSFFSSWSDEDEQAVQQAMQQMGITKYEHVEMTFLSGGEQQRVFVAQALAQQAEVLFLDEPTNHLDIAHQRQLLDVIRTEAKVNGLTVVSIFHDMNLAALYCDRLLLMQKGRIQTIGRPHEVLIDAQIEEVYDTRVAIQPHPEQAKPQVTILPMIFDDTPITICKNHLQVVPQYAVFTSPLPLRTLSSAVHNAGFGWYDTFVNRTVSPNYEHQHVEQEFGAFLMQEGFLPTSTVGMMTALSMDAVIANDYDTPAGKFTIIVTAGVGKAIDVAEAYKHEEAVTIGTINTWIILNAHLSDEAFVQALITATEAKVKALQKAGVTDTISKTVATGTATDSVLIAATQQGMYIQYAGTATSLGKWIGKAVVETTVEAIETYQRLKGTGK